MGKTFCHFALVCGVLLAPTFGGNLVVAEENEPRNPNTPQEIFESTKNIINKNRPDDQVCQGKIGDDEVRIGLHEGRISQILISPAMKVPLSGANGQRPASVSARFVTRVIIGPDLEVPGELALAAHVESQMLANEQQFWPKIKPVIDQKLLSLQAVLDKTDPGKILLEAQNNARIICIPQQPNPSQELWVVLGFQPMRDV
jgi:hypothetical protein